MRKYRGIRYTVSKRDSYRYTTTVYYNGDTHFYAGVSRSRSLAKAKSAIDYIKDHKK